MGDNHIHFILEITNSTWFVVYVLKALPYTNYETNSSLES